LKDILKIKKLSLIIFIVPLVAVNLCLIIVTHFGEYLAIGDPLGSLSFPYIDGKASISRTARVFPSYLIFKPAMIFTGIVLIKYWNSNFRLINFLDTNNNFKKYFRFFGVASAVFLILHSIFLGFKFDADLYKFFRRFILLSFIIFELVAQAILVINLNKIKNNIERLIQKKILILKIALVSTLIIVALITIPFLNSSDHTNLKHALEWNYLLGILLFYLLNYFFWKKPRSHTLSGM